MAHSCDESGVHGAKFYGFGSLWMAWQRRGDFAADVQTLRNRHNVTDELKWTKAGSRLNQPFFEDLIEYFFQRSWLAFHALVVRKAVVDRAAHGGDLDLARRKHFTMLLTKKVQACLKAQRNRTHTFRIWVDPIHSHYQKADEAAEVIANNVLRTIFGETRPVDKVITRDSKDTPSIQLCDFLLGAVMAAWQEEVTSREKMRLQKMIALHLGWPDLRGDTGPRERKFNIWYFYDKRRGAREPETREVKLVYPLPPRPGSAG
jgi:hypothetical protein